MLTALSERAAAVSPTRPAAQFSGTPQGSEATWCMVTLSVGEAKKPVGISQICPLLNFGLASDPPPDPGVTYRYHARL